MSEVNVTLNNFDSEVLQSQKPVLLDFFASWCGPCRMLLPIIDEIARENPDVKVCKVNIDEQPELADKFEVMSVPSLFVIKNGEVTASCVGVRPKAQILEMLK